MGMRFFAFLAATIVLTAHGFAEIALPQECQQVVCVTAPSWTSSRGTLQRWERTGGAAPWVKTGDPVDVVVGERGLGWGIGLHGAATDDGPRKKEGDRKAPAGVFRLTGSFGRAQSPVGKLPWQAITPTLEAIDDPASRFYNRIVDRKKIAQPDWNSSERMAEIPVYKLGIVVAHNPQNFPGSGSCIFLHLRREKSSGTAGCTAMEEAPLVTLARWLDPARQPVLVQFPRAVMQREFPAF
jgi:D-alanyl-D-alanine dipeptidase